MRNIGSYHVIFTDSCKITLHASVYIVYCISSSVLEGLKSKNRHSDLVWFKPIFYFVKEGPIKRLKPLLKDLDSLIKVLGCFALRPQETGCLCSGGRGCEVNISPLLINLTSGH